MKDLSEEYVPRHCIRCLAEHHLQSPTFIVDKDDAVFFNDLKQIHLGQGIGTVLSSLPFRLRDGFFDQFLGRNAWSTGAVASTFEGMAGVPRAPPFGQLAPSSSAPNPSTSLLPPAYRCDHPHSHWP